MLQYFVRRSLLLIPKLLLITIIIFFFMELMPGDALSKTMSPDAYSRLSETQLNELRETLGLNRPVFIRYFDWLWNIFHGQLGYSLASGSPINELLATRLPATFEIVFFALLISTVFGILMGSLSAVMKNTPIDYMNTAIGMAGISIPEFFFGMCFIMLFAVQLKWFPTGGRMSIGTEGFFDRIEYMVLPSICLGIQLIATLMRFTRNSMLDVMNKDYIKTAHAKGLKPITVFFRHIFRNGCTPAITLLIFRLSMLFAGTIVIETVFSYPGIGYLLYKSITTSDTNVCMIILLLTATSVLLCCFIADIVLALLDPRVRFSKGVKTV